MEINLEGLLLVIMVGFISGWLGYYLGITRGIFAYMKNFRELTSMLVHEVPKSNIPTRQEIAEKEWECKK